MIYPFFALAAQSPTRQETFQSMVITHLVVVAGCAGYVSAGGAPAVTVAGHALLILGIVEGAILIGWRLTQLPKSAALEFLLVSQLSARQLFLAEALVGLARLALVTLAGAPILLYFTTVNGLGQASAPLSPRTGLMDLVPLLLMPFTWGAFCGLGLTAWAYEARAIRRWVERLTVVTILVYLIVGVLLAERLFALLGVLFPKDFSDWLRWSFLFIHNNTPFALMQNWLSDRPESFLEEMIRLEAGGILLAGLALARASFRLKRHFDDLHYRPAVDRSRGPRGRPGDRPLSWWAVRRVTEYSGRINLWLASGFGAVYAAYTVAGSSWPAWLGRGVFELVENAGGIPGLATALVVLAAVPAAFQYGLWDSNTQDRCRRLELLLLTQLDALDYWHAAVSAAWKRGRGYLMVAVMLWLAAVLSGKVGVVPMTVAVAAAIILWSLYFVLGFRSFTRGIQANKSGMLLTVGLPLVAYVLFRAGLPALAVLLPPATVYAPIAGYGPLYWVPGPVLAGIVTLVVARRSLAACDAELRRWYERYHGQKVLD